MQLASALLFETPEQIFRRVHHEVAPHRTLTSLTLEFRPFANANSFIQRKGDAVEVRLSDLLADAPAPILEALAHILIGKLYRRPAPASVTRRYRLYLSRNEVAEKLRAAKQSRGRKRMRPPQGRHYNLDELFEQINQMYFHGLMARPALGWSLRASKTHLGHYDPSHHAIILSQALDHPQIPRVLVEYVMYHEMLHLRFPVERRGLRRVVHPKAFREEEARFAQLAEAKAALKTLFLLDDSVD